MAEACSVSDAENKRSLPAWMSKASSDDQVAKTKNQNKEALVSDEQIGNPNQSKPIKRNRGRPLKNLNSEADGELGVLQRCEGREKARRQSKNAVKDEVEGMDELKSKKVRKASGGPALKNSRKRKLENVIPEASSVSVDDDIELTVEDLVTIAEEYVNADKQKQRELETVKTAMHKEHLLCPTICTEADTGQSIVNARSVKGMMQCEAVTRSTRAREHTEGENTSHQEVQCPSSVETTGDIAQEMLNLIFGPLLRKPAVCANKSDPLESRHNEVPRQGEPVKKSEPVESATTTVSHVKEKKDWRSELPKQGEPVIKKKSSLRDKAALFL